MKGGFKMENLFKIDVNTLISVCKNLKELTTEVRFNINNQGLKVLEIDPANVGMVEIEIKKYGFTELTENAEIKSYGLNIYDLFKILKDQKKEFVRVSSEEDKLIFSFSNGFKSELPLINIDSEQKKMPSLDQNTTIEINSKKFKEIVKNCSNVGDALIIEKTEIDTKENNVSFSSKGLSTTEINFNSDDVKMSGENTKSRYSLEYLEKFVKEPISDKVTLKMSNDYPITAEYVKGSLRVTFILAPRITNDD